MEHALTLETTFLIRTISRQRLRQQLDRLSAEDAAQLRRIVTDMYGERPR